MRNLIKRFGAVALSVVMAFSVVSMAFADTARVTFDNLLEPQPDLYVTKTVSSTIDGYTIPDTTFTFQLKWDADGDGILEFADTVSYELLDSSGNSLGTYKTDSTGHFTLKADQYAYFEFAGEIEYEITETSNDLTDSVGSFTQSEPTGGEPATGVIPAEGTIVTFENKYVPYIETEETMLAICKNIAYPDGFEAIDIDTDFSFTVNIGGDVYSDEPYIVYDMDTHDEVDRGTTDSEGTFSIKENQAAVFDEIDVGIDYRVTENDIDGWEAVGTTEYYGSTVGPIIYAYFTNEPTYFVVEKDRTDGITTVDDDFTFILTSDGETPMTDIEYSVYDVDGNYISSGTTDSNGQFTLKAGQKALFIGLKEGTEYTVEESSNVDGYITDDSVYSRTASFDGETNVFTNEPLTMITVKKADKNNTSKLLGGATFEVYNGDTLVGTYTTESDESKDSYGTFTLTGLRPGVYTIVETKAPEGYTISSATIEITLPFTMTEEEIIEQHIDVNSDDFKGIWSERDNCYYFYEITFDFLDNVVLMELPNTGSFPWQWVALGVVLAIAAGTTVLYVRKMRKESEVAEV